MKKRAEIPVGGLYIVAFLILLGLAGMSLYLFLNGQSTAIDYRISAASILQISEEYQKFIDQERRFVIETVLFFLGSQGGVENVAEYNSVNLETVSDTANPDYDIQARACYDILNSKIPSPSSELISRCFKDNPNLFFNPESQGLWKCDNQMYSYQTCTTIPTMVAKLCCENTDTLISYTSLKTNFDNGNEGTANGFSCHQGCLNAFGVESSCSNLDYCGALWCKSNNLEIPETYSGVPYYYKIGDTNPGYYCASSYTFTPENYYDNGTLWEGADTSDIINQLVSLANNYFYKPSPEFSSYLATYFGSKAEVTFQLEFRGCSDIMCEFAWVPYGASTQGFIGRGSGGVPMMEFSSQLVSLQNIPIPVQDMIDFSKNIILQEEIKNYLVSSLENMVFNPHYDADPVNKKSMKDWKNDFGSEVFDINCGGAAVAGAGELRTTSVFDIYDDSGCGEDPYNNDCSYDCLMQHASNELYMSTSNPFVYDRSDAYDYKLRPIFRFIKSSLGASISTGISVPPNTCGDNVCNSAEGETIYNCADCATANNGVCEYGETHANNPVDCWTGCGDNACSNCVFSLQNPGDYFKCLSNTQNYPEESCPTDCNPQNPSLTIRQYEFEALPGEYNIFIQGTGETQASLQFSDAVPSNYQFNYYGEGDYYEMITGPGEIGFCAQNEWDGADLSDYENGFGCCPAINYDPVTGKCVGVNVRSNSYCNLINNKYGNTLKGKSCSYSDNTRVNYDDVVTLSSTGSSNTHTLTLSSSGVITNIDIVRIDFDDTIDVVNVNGFNYGGSYEYYDTQTTADCVRPQGEDFTDFSTLTDEELWYSILSIRAQGYGWDYIIDDMTGLYNAFKSKTYDGSSYEAAADDIEDFLEFISDVCVEQYSNTGITVLNFGELSCDNGDGVNRELVSFSNEEDNIGVFFEEGSSVLPELEYSEGFVSFQAADTMLERLYAIQLNTSYVSLPIKWSFAYRDNAVFDQMIGNVGLQSETNPACDLLLENIPGARAEPECGCKECQPTILPELNFNSVSTNELIARLYHYLPIFVEDDDYIDKEVVR
ncbi:MAG: hypothetical protein JW791_00990 [Nanoarchaeota archaeon]|nr:hypothetical protein [Nanoarchaeota archaeon]